MRTPSGWTLCCWKQDTGKKKQKDEVKKYTVQFGISKDLWKKLYGNKSKSFALCGKNQKVI